MGIDREIVLVRPGVQREAVHERGIILLLPVACDIAEGGLDMSKAEVLVDRPVARKTMLRIIADVPLRPVGMVERGFAGEQAGRHLAERGGI